MWHNRSVFRVNGRGHSKPDVPIFDSFQGQFKIKNSPFDLEFGISEITHFRISKFSDYFVELHVGFLTDNRFPQ